MIHLLDNPVWSALNTGNKNLAQGTASVKYYPTEVSPFVGLKKNDSTSLMDLYNNTPDNNELYAVVDLNEIDIPQPWNLIQSVPLLQMVCENPIQRKPFTEKIINLSVEHIPQMLALTQLTNPGPFRQHTIDYGHYQGIFDGKNLVAMVGQRMYLPPYVEISAICTHPNYLGRGYAAQLILNQINRIRGIAEIPFLHVAIANERAVKLYESLGFVKRKQMFVYMIKK